MIAGTLELQMRMGIAELKTDVAAARREVAGMTQGMERAANAARSAFAALGLSLGVGAFVSMIKGSIDAADHLNDLSKSTALTVEQLAGLSIAAKQSGSDLDGVAGSITKLAQNMGKDAEKFKAAGITARDPLEAFKQLADLFVAIEDPQTRAALGAATLGKNWATAAPLLAEGGAAIGEMVDKGTRLSGVTAELAKQSDAFNDKLVLLTGTNSIMNSVTGQLLPLMNKLAGDMLEAKERAHGLNGSFSPLLEAFKAVVVVGGNVSFVLTAIGKDLGATAAQLVAFASGNWSEILTIRAERLADAAKERSAFDVWERSIMAVGTAAQVAASKLDGMDQVSRRMASQAAAASRTESESAAKRAQALIGVAGAGKAAVDEYAKIVAAADKFVESLKKEADQLGMTTIQKKMMDAATVALTLKTEGERMAVMDAAKAWADAMAAHDKTIATEKRAVEITAAYVKELEDLAAQEAEMKAYTDAKNKAIADSVNATQALIEQIKFETTLIGKSNEERQVAIATRAMEAAGVDVQSAAVQNFIDNLRKALAAQKDAQDANEDSIRQAREAAEAWKKYADSVKANFADMSNSLTDALLGAFTAGKDGARVFIDWLKAEFARTVLRPQMQGAVNSLFGVAGINGTGGAGIFGGVASAIGKWLTGGDTGFGMNDRSLGDSSLSGEFAEGLAKFFGGTATAGQGWTGMAGVFAGAAIGLGVGRSIPGMLGTGDTHHDNANIGTVVGGIIGAYWGAAGSAIGAAIGGIAGGILDSFNPGDADRTANIGTGAGDYTYGSMGGKFGDIGIQRGTDKWFSDADMGQTLNKWFQTIGKLDAEVAKHFSGDEIARATAALAGQSTEYSFGLERTALNPETLTAIVQQRFATIFGAIDSQMADLVTNFKGSGEDLVTLIVDLATVHERLTGLQASFKSLFGQDVGFADISALKGDTEGYTEALERLSNEYAVTNQIAEMLGKTQAEVWGSVGLASEGARAHLINLAGGLEALSGQLDFYYSHFYTTSEQQAHTLAGLQQAFSDVGVGMPRTIDGFRAITDGFLGMGDAGAQAAASMLALAPTFYQYIAAIEAVDAAIRDNGESFAQIFGEQISTESVQAFQQNGEVLTATLARITSEFTATNELLGIFGLTSTEVFGAFGLASEAARAKLIELSGGLDAFSANLAGFYRNYFTEAERAQRSTESLTALFGSFGLEMPTTLQGFRDLVQQQLLLGPAGAAAAAALLGVQQQFFDLIAPATAVAVVLEDTAAAMRKTSELEGRLGVLRGDFTQQELDRAREWHDAASDTDRVLLTEIYRQEDLAEAAQKATGALGLQVDLWNQFATDAQKTERDVAAVRDGFAALGIAIPNSREAFANLVAGIDAATPAGQALLDALKLIAPAFANITSAAATMIGTLYGATPAGPQPPGTVWVDLGNGTGYWMAIPGGAADPGAGNADSIARQRRQLEIELQRALGNDEIALMMERADQLAALDASLRGLQQQVWDALDAAKLRAATEAWVGTLQDFLRGLTLDSTLSPLTARQRFSAAEAQYMQDYLLAGSGDAAARERYTAEAEAYLREALAMFGRGSTEYQAIFRDIQMQTQGLIDQGLTPTAATTVGDVNKTLLTGQESAKEQADALIETIRTLANKVDTLTRRVEDSTTSEVAGTEAIVDAIEGVGRKTATEIANRVPGGALS